MTVPADFRAAGRGAGARTTLVLHIKNKAAIIRPDVPRAIDARAAVVGRAPVHFMHVA